jgi:hypothetical protein
MAELEQEKQKKGILARLSGILAMGGPMLVVILVALFGAIAGLSMAFLRARAETRRYRAESA